MGWRRIPKPLVMRADGSHEPHTMVTGLRIAKGETVRVITATGGGYGPPAERAPEAVTRDLAEGRITAAEAGRAYGRAFGSIPR